MKLSIFLRILISEDLSMEIHISLFRLKNPTQWQMIIFQLMVKEASICHTDTGNHFVRGIREAV